MQGRHAADAMLPGMAIFATLFAFLGRQLSKILTTILGWASTLLFGRVPQDKQLVLVLITFGSIAWVVLLVGVLLPDVGTVLLGFVPVPDVVPEWVVRVVMLVAAIVLPLVLGAATLILVPKDQRPSGGGLVVQVLRGYPLAAFLALSLAVLAVIAVWYKGKAMLRRRESAHVPVIVQPGRYDEFVDELEQSLDEAELDTASKAAPAALALPGRLLGSVAGGGIGSLVPKRLVQVFGSDLEVTIYPTDIAIIGSKERLARARAAIATRLTAAPAYLTTTAEGQHIEDRLRELAEASRGGRAPADAADRLQGIDHDLAALQIDYDEWEVLYRMRLQTERDLLTGREVGTDSPAGGAGIAGGAPGARGATAPGAAASSEGPVERAVGIAGVALVALDALLLLWQRLAPPRSSRRG